MKKVFLYSVVVLMILFSCTKDEYIDDEDVNSSIVRLKSKLTGQDKKELKSWYENEMSTSSNVITRNEIKWHWQETSTKSEGVFTIESLSSKSKKSLYLLEIDTNVSPYKGLVHVYTPFEGFDREVIMTLDGKIVDAIKHENSSNPLLSKGMLLTMSSQGEGGGDPPGGGGWTWDPDIEGWALSEVVVTFYQNNLNNQNASNIIYWSSVTSWTNTNSSTSGTFWNVPMYNFGSNAPSWDSAWNKNIRVLDEPRGPNINNVNDYLSCFNTGPTANNATVTFYVDQPTPGKFDTWSGSVTNPNVGHAFISIQQNGITRTLGYYPSSSNGFKPFNNDIVGPSSFVDDSGHIFDASLTIEITPYQLYTVINTTKYYSSTYHLWDNNCTDYVLAVADDINLSFYYSYGDYPLGTGGDNPGALGQAIRNYGYYCANCQSTPVRNTYGGPAAGNSGSCN